MEPVPSFTLENGLKIPSIGLGTWMADETLLEKALNAALETGYRHIDTAYVYQNEGIIGKVLKEWFSSGKLTRDEVFVTTKLPVNAMRSESVSKFLKESLKSLQLNYVDLYLIHVPFGFPEIEGEICRFKDDGTIDMDVDTNHVEIWQAMEAQYDLGLTKAIGLSNFNEKQIKRILENCKIPPHNLQIEHHINLQQPDLVQFCQDNKIVVTAYSPLGSPGMKALGKEVPDILHNPIVVNIAKKYNKTSAQVLLRHIHQKNIIVIPKSTNPERIRENFNIFDFQLSLKEIEELNGLNRGLRNLDFEFLFKGIKNHPEYPF